MILTLNEPQNNLQFQNNNYYNNFGKFIGLKLDSYLGWNISVNNFINSLDTIAKHSEFNKFKSNSINYEFRLLQAFVKYMFHDNFNGYSRYYKFIETFINKRRYGKNRIKN